MKMLNVKIFIQSKFTYSAPNREISQMSVLASSDINHLFSDFSHDTILNAKSFCSLVALHESHAGFRGGLLRKVKG